MMDALRTGSTLLRASASGHSIDRYCALFAIQSLNLVLLLLLYFRSAGLRSRLLTLVSHTQVNGRGYNNIYFPNGSCTQIQQKRHMYTDKTAHRPVRLASDKKRALSKKVGHRANWVLCTPKLKAEILSTHYPRKSILNLHGLECLKSGIVLQMVEYINKHKNLRDRIQTMEYGKFLFLFLLANNIDFFTFKGILDQALEQAPHRNRTSGEHDSANKYEAEISTG